jgi:cytoskeletal protein CcmA (bactofilin family)
MINTSEPSDAGGTETSARQLTPKPEASNAPVGYAQGGGNKLAIDPVSMGIVNVIGVGTKTTVNMESNGGICIQGDLTAEPLVVRNGLLLVLSTGWLKGHVEVHGDAVIDGRLGSDDPNVQFEITVHGNLRITPKARIHGIVSCGSLQTEPGCQINCMIKMLQNELQTH